jgi:hypothetical protein
MLAIKVGLLDVVDCTLSSFIKRFLSRSTSSRSTTRHQHFCQPRERSHEQAPLSRRTYNSSRRLCCRESPTVGYPYWRRLGGGLWFWWVFAAGAVVGLSCRATSRVQRMALGRRDVNCQGRPFTSSLPLQHLRGSIKTPWTPTYPRLSRPHCKAQASSVILHHATT